jgi:hypothetical protein
MVERVVAMPPAVAAAATFCGWPLSDVSSAVFIVYGLLMIAWHVKTKWLAKWLAKSGVPDES